MTAVAGTCRERAGLLVECGTLILPTESSDPLEELDLADPRAESPPINDRADLVSYFERGCKRPVEWRIGTEHEKFAYRRGDLRPLPFEGDVGIRVILERLQRFGWAPVFEDGNVIALTMDGQAVTLEPSGAVELSGAPLENLHQTCHEVNAHLAQVKEIAAGLDVGFIGLGYNGSARTCP